MRIGYDVRLSLGITSLPNICNNLPPGRVYYSCRGEALSDYETGIYYTFILEKGN